MRAVLGIMQGFKLQIKRGDIMRSVSGLDVLGLDVLYICWFFSILELVALLVQ